MIIDLNTGQGILKQILFPDNQPHIQIVPERSKKAYVTCSITDSKKLLELLMVASALDERRIKKYTLHIPYLMGARYDRIMQPGDSFDLKVIAGMINSCKFKKVYLLDPHSEFSNLLVKNSEVITNEFMLKESDIQPKSVLIIPDLGASKKAHDYFKWNKNLTDSVQCLKERDYATGAFKELRVLEPDKCMNRHCVIVDDLCDGGGTFIGIAKQLKNVKSLTLIVTHGIFSKGFAELEYYFDAVYVSNSYNRTYNSKKVKLIKI